MDYFIMEMWSGIWTLRNTIPLSGFIFLGVICIELLIKFNMSVFMDSNNSMYIKNNWYFNW